ncbi:MAG: cyclic nucleotide-binding domain-containing protein [Vicinamibacteria bacterium]
MAFRKKKQDPFQEIQACLQRRDYKSALDWFNTLLQKDPKNTQIRLRFADTLVLAGSKREAVKQFRVVADELAEKGFMIRAIAINKKILQLDPSQTDVHQKLAAMKEERSTDTASRAALSEMLHRPGDPLRSTSKAPPPPAQPPASLPELSLEESMAMEFGDSHELPGAPESPAEDVEEVQVVEEFEEVAVEEPAATPTEEFTGGFELVDESTPVSPPSPAFADEAPTFAEEPVVFTDSVAEEEEIEIVTVDAEASEGPAELSFDGVEEPVNEFSGAEIVVDAQDEAPDEEAEEVEEVEIVELDVESEPALAADGAESLIGALGEDIDSLIDSIIDDIGSSAHGAAPSREPPPTHIPLFSDLTTSEFIAVALLLVRRVAKVGEVIVREGDPGASMFIVSTGEVRATILREGAQVPVATMRDGDFFGEMAVLSGEPRTATVTAVKSTELLELSREHLSEICARHPHVEAKIRLAYDERVSRSAPPRR